MRKVISSLIVLFLIISQALAEQSGNEFIPLKLSCFVSFQNYDGIEEALTTKQVKLDNHKHEDGGVSLVTQTDSYEFWAMTHGIQSTAGAKAFIRDFQVAIRHKQSGLFMHALSNETNSPENQAKKARISLVSYYPNTTLRYRKYKPPFCSSSEASYSKSSHSFTAQAPIFTAGSVQITLIRFGLTVR